MKISFVAALFAVAAIAAPAPEPIDLDLPDLGLGGGRDGPRGPFRFTSVWRIRATPGQVVNGTTPTGGLQNARGTFAFGINSDFNTICYNITLTRFRGEYSSLALTATHIHQAARGTSGPPRIAFPNPVAIGGEKRRSVGCITGPFRTGINDTTTGQDTGANFNVRAIEQDPELYFADVHSSLAVPGAVRGQFE